MKIRLALILRIGMLLLISCRVTSLMAEQVPLYQQILDHLKADPDVVLPWSPLGALDTDTMYNRESPIPPQCYTDNGGIHNPCYVCHQDQIPGRGNSMNDHDLQEDYRFSDTGLTNHWRNLFEDRSARVNQISDAEILNYINRDNYSELPQRLTKAGFKGWIPDLANLQLGAAAFDADGFAKDGSWWVTFSYKPLPSTFWPTQGSTDDVMIRLPVEFYTNASGVLSKDVYKANLALLEANIKGYEAVSSWPINEAAVGVDLNDDGNIGVSTSVSGNQTRYFGAASTVDIIPHVYPMGTEFLHTVRYVGVAADGSIYNPPHMKEVRYMKRRTQSRHFQLLHYYEEENLEKEMGSLPSYKNFGHEGLSSNFGWNITGFIENKEGRLRWNTYEENTFCMGCHSTIGSTIDKTFSFVRKVDGSDGWGYINLRAMKDAPNVGETLNESATYLNRVGGGTEFRSNPELEARFYHANGTVNTIALATTTNVYDLVAPSPQRALMLNKAYKAIVEQQDFIFGREATVTPPKRVLKSVDNKTSTTLTDEHQYNWNMLLDWSAASDASCNYIGDVDFGQLQTTPHIVSLAGSTTGAFNRVCAEGTVTLSGPLHISLANNYVPSVGATFELIRGGIVTGKFSQVVVPQVRGLVFELEQTNTSLMLRVLKDTDLNNDGITNQLDLSLLRPLFGGNNTAADFNGDGIVNQPDVNILRAKFGHSQ